MDYHYSKKSKIVFGISILGLLVPIGSSLFIISDRDSNHSYNTTSEANAVAYIEGLDGIYFPTVSDAITYAYGNDTEDTIYVIPGDVDREYTQSYIDEDCTLESVDTLIIPYEGETYEDEDRDETNDDFADYNSGEYDYYLTSEVIISNGVTFTNEGTIYIGGMLGTSSNSYSNQRPTGHVVNKYTQISMEYNSSLINAEGGIIYSYGYIKKRLDTSLTNQNEPYIENMDGSTFHAPFVIYDYKGGTFTGGGYYIGEGNDAGLAFSIFDIPNIQTLFIFDYGSKMYGLATLLYDGDVNKFEINVIGLEIDNESFLFELESGSISLEYDTRVYETKKDDNGNSYDYTYAYKDFYEKRSTAATDNTDLVYTNVTIYEDTILNIGSFSFTVSISVSFITLDIDIDSSKIYVPFSYKFNITVKDDAVVNVGNTVEFLLGSHFTIEEGGEVYVTANLTAYLDYLCVATHPDLSTYFPSDLGPAEIINNGYLYIDAPFGGFIQTSKSTGQIVTGSNFENSIITREFTKLSSSDFQYSMDLVKNYALGYITSDNTLDEYVETEGYKCFAANSSYESRGTFWYTNETSSILDYDGSLENTYSTDSGNICFEKGTLVYTRRGNIAIEEITLEDEVLSFNHFTGKFEYKPISLIVNHGIGVYEIMNMQFSDGSEINLIGNHGLFDKTLNKYVDVCVDNCFSFINHDFVRYIDGEIKFVKLINVNIESRTTESYTCFSFGNLNTLANNFLNITSIVYGFYNLFNYLENMQYDAKEIEEDIAKYGLTSYEELKDYVSKDIFEAFNGKYINIAISKGLLTHDSLMDLIKNWLNKLVKNKEAFTNYDVY